MIRPRVEHSVDNEESHTTSTVHDPQADADQFVGECSSIHCVFDKYTS